MDSLKGIGFYGLADFCLHGEWIKSEYCKLNLFEKRMYKYHVYSNSFLTVKERDLIWEYLNEPMGSVYYVTLDMLKSYCE